eukprot:gene845-940_t
MGKPLCNREKILSRQEGVGLGVRPDNLDFVRSAEKLLRKVHDLYKVLLRIKKAEGNERDWVKLARTLEAALSLMDLMTMFCGQNRHPTDRGYLTALLSMANYQARAEDDSNEVSTRDAYVELVNVMDIDAMEEMGEIVVREGCNVQLDQLRSTYGTLEDVLSDAARRILQEAPLLLRVSVEYVPQVGYLVAIEDTDRQLVDPERFTFVYSQDGISYFKNDVVYS